MRIGNQSKSKELTTKEVRSVFPPKARKADWRIKNNNNNKTKQEFETISTKQGGDKPH
jgi:hypothetical protein